MQTRRRDDLGPHTGRNTVSCLRGRVAYFLTRGSEQPAFAPEEPRLDPPLDWSLPVPVLEVSPAASVLASVHASDEQSGMGAGSEGVKKPQPVSREATKRGAAKYANLITCPFWVRVRESRRTQSRPRRDTTHESRHPWQPAKTAVQPTTSLVRLSRPQPNRDKAHKASRGFWPRLARLDLSA